MIAAAFIIGGFILMASGEEAGILGMWIVIITALYVLL